MSQYFASARAWLAAIDPALPAASLVLVVFISVYLVRRFWPSAWRVVEASVPFAGALDAGPVLTVLWKSWQSLPGVLLGAAVSALSNGLSVESALYGVLAGAASSVAHELMAAYQGQVGAGKPPSGGDTPPQARKGIPPLVGGALMLMLALSMPACAALSAAVPVISEAAILLTDATNAVNIAEDDIAALHLPPGAEAEAEADIGKARQAIAAADAIVDGAKDITAEQLDAALADFRAAWSDIERFFAVNKPATARAVELPVPLALHRVKAQ